MSGGLNGIGVKLPVVDVKEIYHAKAQIIRLSAEWHKEIMRNNKNECYLIRWQINNIKARIKAKYQIIL